MQDGTLAEPPGRQLAARAPVSLGQAGLSCIHVPAAEGMPTVLLLHGWVMNKTTWADAAARLTDEGYGLLLPDLPGHGTSPGLPRVDNHTVYDEMATRLVSVLDELKLERVAVAGYSMGATAAAALTRLAPERVSGLFVINPIVRFPPFQMLRSNPLLYLGFFFRIVTGFFRPRGVALMRAWFGLHVAGFWLPWGLKRAILKLFDFKKQDPAGVTFVGCRQASDVELFLDGFVCTDWWTTAQTLEGKHRVNYLDVFRDYPGPIHIATGKDDPFAPVSFCQKVLAKRGQAAHKFTALDGDHLVVCKSPEPVGQVLREFVEAVRERA